MKRDIWWRQQKCWHGKKIFDAKSFFLESTYTLRDKCPNKELFLVLIFPRSEIFVFSPNTGKQKIWPRKNSLFGHFSHRDTHTDVDIYNDLEKFQDHIHWQHLTSYCYWQDNGKKGKTCQWVFIFCLTGLLHTKRSSGKMRLGFSAKLLF